MFGLDPSISAKNALNFFQKNNINNIVEFGAGLGRDTLFFAKNFIHVNAIDYSPSGIKVIKEKAKNQNLSKFISTQIFDVRKKLPFKDNSVEACFSHMLYCMALTSVEIQFLNTEGEFDNIDGNQKTRDLALTTIIKRANPELLASINEIRNARYNYKS